MKEVKDKHQMISLVKWNLKNETDKHGGREEREKP